MRFKLNIQNFAAPAINLDDNQKAERRLFAVYVDISGKTPQDTGWIPVWEVQGKGVEDSSVELNPDDSTVTDILGITEKTVNKLEESQSFEPNTIRGGQKLNEILLDIVRKKDVSRLSNFTVLRAWTFLGGSGIYEAEYDEACTITPQSIGGSSFIDMPMEISYSGKRTFGTVDKLTDPVFTKSV